MEKTKTIILDDERIKDLIDILHIKTIKQRGLILYKTRWGEKTQIGLIDTIKRILTPEPTAEPYKHINFNEVEQRARAKRI